MTLGIFPAISGMVTSTAPSPAWRGLFPAVLFVVFNLGVARAPTPTLAATASAISSSSTPPLPPAALCLVPRPPSSLLVWSLAP